MTRRIRYCPLLIPALGALIALTSCAGNNNSAQLSPLPDATLTVVVTGAGNVTSSPSGIDCPTTCRASFNAGTTVTLTATPSSQFELSGYSGACSGTSCTVMLTASQTVTATFVEQAQLPLAVSIIGSGVGTVVSSPAGINCPTSCSGAFPPGTQVTLTATAASGSSFAGWGEECSGSGNCQVTMASATSISAAFARSPTEVLYTISQDGNDTHAYSIDSTTRDMHEQPGSPFDLGAVDRSSPDTPAIIGSTPNGALLLIHKANVRAGTSAIYVARTDASSIPILPPTDARTLTNSSESLISPSGQFVYVHQFDESNTVNVYTLGEDGKLRESGSVQLGENGPIPPGPMYSLGWITADSKTLIVTGFASHTCTARWVYRLVIDEKSGLPSPFNPADSVWETSTCGGEAYGYAYSELLAVDSRYDGLNDPPLPVMTDYILDGVNYTANATCDSTVRPLCQSLTFAVPPRSNFVVIQDSLGTWHSLDAALNDTGNTVFLPGPQGDYSATLDFSPDGRLMLLIWEGIQMALFEPATGEFKTVAEAVPGGFDTWSVISIQP